MVPAGHPWPTGSVSFSCISFCSSSALLRACASLCRSTGHLPRSSGDKTCLLRSRGKRSNFPLPGRGLWPQVLSPTQRCQPKVVPPPPPPPAVAATMHQLSWQTGLRERSQCYSRQTQPHGISLGCLNSCRWFCLQWIKGCSDREIRRETNLSSLSPLKAKASSVSRHLRCQEQGTGVCQMASRGDATAKDVLTAAKRKVPAA